MTPTQEEVRELCRRVSELVEALESLSSERGVVVPVEPTWEIRKVLAAAPDQPAPESRESNTMISGHAPEQPSERRDTTPPELVRLGPDAYHGPERRGRKPSFAEAIAAGGKITGISIREAEQLSGTPRTDAFLTWLRHVAPATFESWNKTWQAALRDSQPEKD